MNVQNVNVQDTAASQQDGSRRQPDIGDLVRRSLRGTAAVLDAVGSWDAASRCSGWTVRQAGNHLAGSVMLLTHVAEGRPAPAAGLDPQAMADTDHLGQHPAAAFEAIARRAVTAFTDPGILAKRFDFPVQDAPGALLASICLLESLVHGWDIAAGAGVRYRPDPDVVTAVREFAANAIGDQQRERGLFGPPVRAGASADELTALLGHLGRRV